MERNVLEYGLTRGGVSAERKEQVLAGYDALEDQQKTIVDASIARLFSHAPLLRVARLIDEMGKASVDDGE